jgi:hypothetical protein
MRGKAFIAVGAGLTALLSTGVASASWFGPTTGKAGTVGPAGRTGATGPRGVKGDTGATGATGATGRQSVKGDTGATGATGATGRQGVNGDTGANGATGATGRQGVKGATGATGATGPQGPAGPGSVGSAYTVPASGASGGYLELSNANYDFSLDLTCNYGVAGDSETFWFANQSSRSASVVETFIGGGVGGVYTFPTVTYGQGGTDRVNPTSWPYQATFTINEAGILTRWDVTVTGSSGGPCTYTVYQNGDGSAAVHP